MKITTFSAVLAAAFGLLTAAFQAAAYPHPSVPFTTSDLATLKANLNTEPWKSGYAALAADGRSSLTYTMQGPFANVSRNPNINLNQWRNDMTAIYNLARMWYFTGNNEYGQKARNILRAWADTQTSFTGMEGGLDLGDYAFRFVGGADILRGTWPGWTQADTDAVKNLFGNVYWTLNGNTLGPTNKGSLSLAAAAAIAAFNDDPEKMEKVLLQYRAFASTGLRNSLSNGEHGETGRDNGHSYNHIAAMSFVAEIFWKQGIDLYSELDNRLLAMGEYYCRYVLGTPTSFVPMGTTDEYYMGFWDDPGYTAEPRPFYLLKSHYELRKGLPTPWINRKLASQPGNADAFMFLKSADSSTATRPAPMAFPSHSRVSTGLISADIGGATPAGSSRYNNGAWTVTGQGSDIWTHGSEAFHFVYKQVAGDCTLIAKVESIQNLGTSNKAGVMLRSDLNPTPAAKAWVALKPDKVVESYFHGWAEMYGGSNWEKQGYGISQPSWWVKVERLGNIVTTYASPDGTSWATLVIARYDNLGASPYLGLCVSSNKPGTLCTATFSNVSITTGDGAAPVTAPAAPLSFLAAPAENRVPLRWSESFGATSYNVKRATISGGPYSTIATVTVPSYLDGSVNNGVTYYYVVSAVNAFGEGPNSQQDSATPLLPMVNVAFGGTATSSDTPTGTPGAEGPAKAFDTLPGSKWFNGTGSAGWLQYDFGSGNTRTIKKYSISSGNDMPDRDPRSWQFQGSNDGSAWTTLDTQSNRVFTYRYQSNAYTIATPGAYRFYRLNITANNGNATGIQLSELALLADTGRTLPNGTYTISSRRSRKLLDLQNGSTANGTAAVQQEWNGGNSQKWTLTDSGKGQYQIGNLLSGTFLEVYYGRTENGTRIQIWPWLDLNNQKWTATPAGDGFYKLTAAHSGKLADVNGGSAADGSTIIQWQDHGGDNQQWSFALAP